MNRNFLGGLALLFLFGGATAQNLRPIDPLQRPKYGAGSSSFGLSAGYAYGLGGGGLWQSNDLGLHFTHQLTEDFAVKLGTEVSFASLQSIQNGAVQSERITS